MDSIVSGNLASNAGYIRFSYSFFIRLGKNPVTTNTGKPIESVNRGLLVETSINSISSVTVSPNVINSSIDLGNSAIIFE